MANPAVTPAPLLRMEGITKSFAGVQALDNANLVVHPAEIHAVVGQNGAGKSTLVKILNGAYRRDAGAIILDGVPVDFRTPQEAVASGVSTIYQEINLVPYRSVAENIFLGREPRRFGFIDWPQINRQAREILARFDIDIDVTQPLMTLNVALQQMVAIARAVSFRSRLVIMDEPTSSLDEREVATLFGVINDLKADGTSVIFITHRLDELYAVCDRVTIMRDGKSVGDQEMSEITKLELVARMLGRELGEIRRSGQTGFTEKQRPIGEPLLAANDLKRGRALQDADLRVSEGEVVGLAGLLGSGRTEVARAVFGADKIDSGEIAFRGRNEPFNSPAEAIAAGIGLCTEDRQAEGIIPQMSVRENLTLAALPVLTRHGIVDTARQREIVDRFIKRLAIRTSGPDQPIRELSGGNQQKVLLARWLCLNPKLLILDEPTRGIDVGAKAEIQSLIDELARTGLGVLMISSELEELIEGGDRVVVMREGRTVAELSRQDATQDAIIGAMVHEDKTVSDEDGVEAPAAT